MFTVAMVNQKGGSGKSTLAECLAVAAYLDDKAVAILDIDPQGTVYKWARRRENPNPVVESVTPASYGDQWQRLKEAGADLVIFDTPARLSDHTTGPIELADIVIIPAKATMKDLERVGASYDLIQKTSDTRTFVMINQARPQGDRADQSIEFLTSKGLTVCPYSFGYRVAFEDAGTTGQTPQETEPRGKAAAEISAVYRYTIETLNHLTIEGTNHGKGFSRTVA
jgi:chromosome partitioning protein